MNFNVTSAKFWDAEEIVKNYPCLAAKFSAKVVDEDTCIIKISSLDSLMELMREVGCGVIVRMDPNEITIYDDYVE